MRFLLPLLLVGALIAPTHTNLRAAPAIALPRVERLRCEYQELPLAIMVTVLSTDGSVHSWLRRVAASGYRERWGKWEPAKKTE